MAEPEDKAAEFTEVFGFDPPTSEEMKKFGDALKKTVQIECTARQNIYREALVAAREQLGVPSEKADAFVEAVLNLSKYLEDSTKIALLAKDYGFDLE